MKKLNKDMIIAGLLTGLSLGTLLIIVDNTYMTNKNLELVIIIGFIAYLISSYLHTIIHEAGHLVFGLLSGYKFVSFRIGNIMLIKIKNKLKFKKFSLLGTAGQCLMEPPKLIDNKVPNALYNLGGVLMNLIVSMITIILIIIFKNYPLVTCVLEIFALIGIYYAALNGIPLKLQINNDGMNTISLKKHPESQKSFWIQLMMNAEQTKGKRMKDMPNDWFYFPTDEQMENSIETTIGTLYCNKLLDEHKFEETKNSIIKLLKSKAEIIDIYKYLLTADRIYCELLDNNIEKANKLLTEEQKKIMKSMKTLPSIIRTEYAIAKIIDKDTEKCSELLQYFEKIKEKYPYQGDIESEEELINIIKNKEKAE